MEDSAHGVAKTGLLSLPAELRAMIFSFVLEHVYCRYAVLVWDHISIAKTAGKSTKGVGILLACRTTYQDCIDLIYENAVVHMSVRGDTQGHKPQFTTSLGPIKQCALLAQLKHIQLEISYRASRSGSVKIVVERIQRLARAFQKASNLKTVDLVFFDEGSRYREDVWRTRDTADPILEAAMQLKCEQVVAVSRNETASWYMTPVKWQSLRRMAGGMDGGREEFREITFDYCKCLS